MIFNVSYKSKAVDSEINELVGRPFSFMERIRMRGVGTSKMEIMEISVNLGRYFQERSGSRFCYLELRPAGLLVGFQSHLKTYVLAIPFHQLSIYYNGGLLSIYSKDYSIKMKPPFNGSVDKKYLSKVLDMKTSYLENLKA